MRITVGVILKVLVAGKSVRDVLEAYPELEEDVRQALQYAAMGCLRALDAGHPSQAPEGQSRYSPGPWHNGPGGERMAILLDLLRPVTDEELLRLSERNPGYQFERTADGRLVVSPTGGKSGRRSAEVLRQLADWNRGTRLGIVFDSSTGFHLPDGSLLSPDASWVVRERWEALSSEEQERFAPLCPDAVFEVRSAHQTSQELREKMRAYLRNGARIGVLLDPYERTVDVYRPGLQPERYEGPDRVGLDPELPGFVLELGPVFEE